VKVAGADRFFDFQDAMERSDGKRVDLVSSRDATNLFPAGANREPADNLCRLKILYRYGPYHSDNVCARMRQATFTSKPTLHELLPAQGEAPELMQRSAKKEFHDAISVAAQTRGR